MPAGTLRNRLSQRYNLPLHLATFFALLIKNELVTAVEVHGSLGNVDHYGIARRLRIALRDYDIEVRSRRALGYWLDTKVRNELSAIHGVTVPDQIVVVPLAQKVAG